MHDTKTIIKKIFIVAVITVMTGAGYFLVGEKFLASLLPQGTTVVTGDVYIPNYDGSPGQQGEIQVKVNKALSKVAGVQFTVNFPADKISLYDASVSGLPTSSFNLVKNTNNPGNFQIAMVQATGIDIPVGSTILTLSVDIKSTVAQGTDIPLSLNDLSIFDENTNTLAATTQNGKITMNGGTITNGTPYIQSIVPDYALSSADVSIIMNGKNLPSAIQSVEIGDTKLTNVTVTNGEIRGTLPKGLSTGIYDVVITGTNGERVEKKQAFSIVDQAEGMSVEESASYFTPSKVKNDGQMKTTLWVLIDDLHGVEDIAYVDVNLSSIGGAATTRLIADKIVDKSQWFYLANITVPSTVSTSNTPYHVSITATNRIGKVAKGNIPLTVIGDTEVNVRPVVRQAYTIPPFVQNDGKTTFSLVAYVTDDDGADKLDNVVVDLSSIGNGTKTMTKDGSGGLIGNGYWYRVDGLTVSTQISEGSYSATVSASNKTGDTGTGVVTITVSSSVGGPRVDSNQSYTTPYAVANDGSTPVTLYAFVSTNAGSTDITQVVVDLRELGLKPVNKMVADEVSGKGRWYTFTTNVPVINAPSFDPYRLTVTATDTLGRIGQGYINLKVLEMNPNDVIAPQIEAAVPVSSGKIEVIFNKDIDEDSLSLNGYNFTLYDRNDTTQTLDIEDATINTKGNIVTLTTESQEENKPYTIVANTNIKDVQGISLKRGSGDKSNFRGFNAKDTKAAEVRTITATSPTTVEVEFWTPIQPSTVSSDGADFRIFEVLDSRELLNVSRVNFKDSMTLVLTTEEQKYGLSYGVTVTNLVNANNGKKVSDLGVEVFFKGYISSLVGDLNYDKKIDFQDFTIFTNVYRDARGYGNANVNVNSSVTNNSNVNSKTRGNGNANY